MITRRKATAEEEQELKWFVCTQQERELLDMIKASPDKVSNELVTKLIEYRKKGVSNGKT